MTIQLRNFSRAYDNCVATAMLAQPSTWQFLDGLATQTMSEAPSNLPCRPSSGGYSEATSSITNPGDMLYHRRPGGVNLLGDQSPKFATSPIDCGIIAEPVCPSETLAVLNNLEYERSGHGLGRKIDDITLWIDSLELTPSGFRKNCFAQVVPTAGFVVKNPQAPGLKQLANCARQPTGPCKENPDTSRRPKCELPSIKKLPPNRKRSRISDEESGNSNPKADTVLPADAIGLACPFTKHNPERYKLVNNACTKRSGFRDIKSVVEHLKRVHSLTYPCCSICKRRFHGNLADARQNQREHAEERQCVPMDLTPCDPEWMNEEQDGLIQRSIIRGRGSAKEKWQSIYCYLFPNTDENSIPEPDYNYLMPIQLTTQPVRRTEDLSNQTANHRTVNRPSPTPHSLVWQDQVTGQLNHNCTNLAPQFGQTAPKISLTEPHAPENNLETSDLYAQSLLSGSNARPSGLGNKPRRKSSAEKLYSPNPSQSESRLFITDPDKLGPGSFAMVNATHSPNNPLTLSPTLTPEALALYEDSYPQSEFEYTVYQARDSGYQSLGYAPEICDEARAEPTLTHPGDISHNPIGIDHADSNVFERNPSTHHLDIQSDLIGCGARLTRQSDDVQDSMFNDAFDPEMVRGWDE